MSFTPSVAMAATASASSTGPRYAPHDPTLPKPWRVLVCGNTGNLYFWNSVTNVTQYEMPVTSSPAAPLSMSKSATESSVQIQQLSILQSKDRRTTTLMIMVVIVIMVLAIWSPSMG